MALHEEAKTQATFDALPPGDSRRQSLLVLGGIFDRLVSARRYDEIVAVRTFDQMNREFALMAMERPAPPGISPDRINMMRQASRAHVISAAARDIEVLAGAGRLDEARAMAGKLFAYDTSPATRATVEERLARAGSPALLNDTGRP